MPRKSATNENGAPKYGSSAALYGHNGSDSRVQTRVDNLKKEESRRTESAPPSPSLNIKRLAYNLPQFNEKYDQIVEHRSAGDRIKTTLSPDISKRAWTRRLKTLLPVLAWLPEYSIRRNLVADILVGFTIAVFQVPQSMGYSLIAHVTPEYGLYSSFFPSLAYMFFGTSMHSSVGAFAIVSGVMTGNVVVDVMKELGKPVSLTGSSLLIYADNATTARPADQWADLTNIDIVVMVSAIIGAYILVFGVLQLGFLNTYMSEELVSGFVCSASIYVFASQIRYLIGVDLTYFSGPFALIHTVIEIFERLDEVNLTALAISGICMAILLFFKLGVNRLTRCIGIRTPFPIDLFVVIGGTLASQYLDLNEDYQVQVVGTIPRGFPAPQLPRLALFKHMWIKCIPVAIVGYIITISVGKMYGAKHGYKVDANQEMLAMGITNIWSAFFRCLPAAASLPRSALLETAGGKTQIVSLVNCLCQVAVILALGSLLEDLPNCVLGSCIAVALVSLVARIQDFIRFWKISKLDSTIWIVTFAGVIILNVDYGIYIGLVYSIMLLVYKSQRPKVYLLGAVDGSEIYVPVNKYKLAKQIDGVVIFQFCGPLNFANSAFFQSELELNSVGDLIKLRKQFESVCGEKKKSGCCGSAEPESGTIEDNNNNYNDRSNMARELSLPGHIIVDCSMFSHIDSSGITTLTRLSRLYDDIGVALLFAGCPVHIEKMLSRSEFFSTVSQSRVYASVHDAVAFVCQDFTDSEPEFTAKPMPRFSSEKFWSTEIEDLEADQILIDAIMKKPVIPRAKLISSGSDSPASSARAVPPTVPIVRPIYIPNAGVDNPLVSQRAESKPNIHTFSPTVIPPKSPRHSLQSPPKPETPNTQPLPLPRTSPLLKQRMSVSTEPASSSSDEGQPDSLVTSESSIPPPPPPLPPLLPPLDYEPLASLLERRKSSLQRPKSMPAVSSGDDSATDSPLMRHKVSAGLLARTQMLAKFFENQGLPKHSSSTSDI